jgi:hypothetical protein
MSPPSSRQKSEPSKELAEAGRTPSPSSSLIVSLFANESEGDKLLRNGGNPLLQVSGFGVLFDCKGKGDMLLRNDGKVKEVCSLLLQESCFAHSTAQDKEAIRSSETSGSLQTTRH